MLCLSVSVFYTGSIISQVYAADCELRWDLIWHRTDTFVIAHFIGWVVKAIMIRHAGILWLLSIMWEVTEVCLALDTLSSLSYIYLETNEFN